MEPLELSEELSASFYAAATAVSHFKKQCLLEVALLCVGWLAVIVSTSCVTPNLSQLKNVSR